MALSLGFLSGSSDSLLSRFLGLLSCFGCRLNHSLCVDLVGLCLGLIGLLGEVQSILIINFLEKDGELLQ